MNEKIKVLYYALWVAHPLFQMGIATLMFRRGLHRKFKFFFVNSSPSPSYFPRTGIVIPPVSTSTGLATP